LRPPMSTTVCAICRVRPIPSERSVCLNCFPETYDRDKSWWMKVAEAKQEERDKALARVKELEQALRYAAGCATLEMVRDTARGMGVIE
jgi:hypothetical protein